MQTTINIDDNIMDEVIKIFGDSVPSTDLINFALTDYIKLKNYAYAKIEKNGNLIDNDLTNGDNLADLVSKITADNLHNEIDFGIPMGNEIW